MLQDYEMKNKDIKFPKPNAVQELRERYNKRKEERLRKYDELAEVLKKQSPLKKTAKGSNPLDAEL